jgi:GNAT superfamily N-acetyltransferase
VTAVREILAGETWRAAEAMRELRPRWADRDTLVDVIDNRLRPVGYRLVGAFEDGAESAASVCGFRETTALAWGHYLYVDDVSTIPAARGRGHADLLMAWVIEEGRRRGLEAVHLDSGVGADRAAAHRLYMRHHLRISSHHFQLEL